MLRLRMILKSHFDRLKFENFLSDMGECPPHLEIDRINNDGHYEKENCRWVTHKENCNNRRNNV